MNNSKYHHSELNSMITSKGSRMRSPEYVSLLGNTRTFLSFFTPHFEENSKSSLEQKIQSFSITVLHSHVSHSMQTTPVLRTTTLQQLFLYFSLTARPTSAHLCSHKSRHHTYRPNARTKPHQPQQANDSSV